MFTSDAIFVGAVVLLFIAVVLGVEGLFIWWNSRRGPEVKRVARRLQMMSAGGHIDAETASVLKQRLLSNSPFVEQLLLRMPRVSTLDRMLVQSGLDWTVSNLLFFCGMLFVVGFLGMLAFRFGVLIALPTGLILATVPFAYLSWNRSRRLTRFESMLPEAMDLIARALRSGHSFPSALQMTGDELPEPLGSEFRQTFDEVNFGVPMNSALQNLCERVPSTDLGFFVIAVLIQRETGGNLAEILDNISAIIRERLKLLGRVRAISAEGRTSGWVLSLLPFVTAFILFMVNPELMSILWTDPIGIRLLVGGMVFMVIGIFCMRKIIRIHV
ncbi:MAG: type II secretion system F family protein [Burkholderiales bacterium]|nr:MAG: type II secretion system F family protein [Burkholderiales bacterium]